MSALTYSRSARAHNANGGGLLPLLAMGAMTLFAFAALSLLPQAALSGWTAWAVIVATLFCIGLMLCSKLSGVDATFSMTIYVWWFLIVSEQFFVRKGVSQDDLSGHFSASAYSESAIWVLIGLAAFVILYKHGLRLSASISQMKWPMIFVVVAILSCAYSPTPGFSLAWAFKLLVSVVLLVICAAEMPFGDHPARFLKSLFWAYVVLVFSPLATTLTHPSTMFGWRGFAGDLPPEFRLNTNIHPVDLSEHAALLVLFALALHAYDKKRSRLLVAAFAALVMLLAVGKAAILSCVICSVFFFVLQGKFKAGATWFVGVMTLGFLALMLTPIGNYFHDYTNNESAETLTGRTALWELAAPEIKAHPMVGHGFMASKFVAEAVDADWDAGQLHNAFLEVLYNNGLIGFVPILAINLLIVRNVWVVMRRSRTAQLRTLAAGAASVYLFLLLNGFVEPTFGGRPSCVFLVFEGLLALTQGLRVVSRYPVVDVPSAPSFAMQPAGVAI